MSFRIQQNHSLSVLTDDLSAVFIIQYSVINIVPFFHRIKTADRDLYDIRQNHACGTG